MSLGIFIKEHLMAIIVAAVPVITAIIAAYDKYVFFGTLKKKLLKAIFQVDVEKLFKDSITNPSYKLEDLHRHVLKYYEKDKITYLSDFSYVNYEYMQSCIPFLDELDVPQRDKLKFPILYKKRWTLSGNSNLGIGSSFDADFRRPNLAKNCIPRMNYYSGESYFYEFFNTVRNGRLFNSGTYDLFGMEGGDQLQLNFCKGHYKDLIDFNEAIGYESKYYSYRRSLWDNVTHGNKIILNCKRKISKWLSSSPRNYKLRKLYPLKELLSYREYPCSIGLNIFTIFKANAKYYTFIQFRDPGLAEIPNLDHVLPAGTFQPHPGRDNHEWKQQCSFVYTVFRELLEELFDKDFLKKQSSPEAQEFLFSKFDIVHKRTREVKKISLDDFIHFTSTDNLEGEFKIIPTSFSIDLISLKPQVSLVLYFESDYLLGIASDYCIGSSDEGLTRLFDVESDTFKEFVISEMNRDCFTQTGSIALAEGYDYFLRHIKLSETIK